MQSPDQDFRCVLRRAHYVDLIIHILHRFMGLNDLMNEIRQDQNCYLGDEAVENKVLYQVLALVEDKISEVKNQAVKWHVFDGFLCAIS